eukprot:gene31240-40219_t
MHAIDMANGQSMLDQRSSRDLNDDSTIARALQMLEFEMIQDIIRPGADTDFNEKEFRASTLKRQLFTLSTVVGLTQVVVLIVMIARHGTVPLQQNPFIGPSAQTMLNFGAKDAYLIVVEKQWWRVLVPIMLHAGVLHVLCNVLIQLRIGGYLNLVFGNLKWSMIYIFSGVFGNIV